MQDTPSEHRFRTIIEHSSEVYTLIDEHGLMTYVSPSVERILGFLPDELLGRSIFDYVPHEEVDQLRSVFAQLLAKPGGSAETNARFRNRFGTYRLLDAIGTNLLDDPEMRAIVVISRDITEQVAMREQLLQSQKLEAIGRLAGGIAHDFNNLLTVISFSAELMLSDLAADDPNRAEAERITDATARAARLTRQLLAFGRKQVLRLEPIDISSVVRSMERMLERLIGEDIEIVTRSSEALPAVAIDVGQMEQVLVNLALNSRDAMPHGGVLVFETSKVTFYTELALAHDGSIPPGVYVALSATDTGTGMDRETLSRIFEPFFTTKGSGRGTGLGLATVHGIVRQSGGYIDVHSEPGRGTTFTLYFPVVDVAELNPPAPPAPVPRADRLARSVLLVEDEEGVRRATRKMLERSGMLVLEAPHGADALALLLQHSGPLDVLVTDMVMPGIDGAELARRVRAQRPSIGLVLMSGYSEAATMRRWVVPDGAVLLEKPFGAEKLHVAVEQAFAAAGR